MKFLLFPVVAVLLPVLMVILLAMVAVGCIVVYVAWLVGVPVKVKVNGVTNYYRWLKKVG